MLEAIELLPARRRSPRHACQLQVPLVCDLWDEPVAFETRDVSIDGLFFETTLALDPGTEVVLELRVGGETHFVIGSVRRADLHDGRPGMGVELLDVDDGLRAALDRAICRRPPALPRGPAPILREQVWVDALLTWEEDLGDRVNIFEVSELIGLSDDQADFDEAFDRITPHNTLLC